MVRSSPSSPVTIFSASSSSSPLRSERTVVSMKSFCSFVTAQWYAHHARTRVERDAEVHDHSDSLGLARAPDADAHRRALTVFVRMGGHGQHRAGQPDLG